MGVGKLDGEVVTLITDLKKCQYFQRQQQEYKKGFQVKAKKWSLKCNACYFIVKKRPTGLALGGILVRGLGRIQCEVRVFMNEA